LAYSSNVVFPCWQG